MDLKEPLWVDDCDCGGPAPPQFLVPPPPPPPSLGPCLGELQLCHAEPWGMHFGGASRSPFTSLPTAIVVASGLLAIAAGLVVGVLIWKNKRKMQQVMLPFKNNPPSDIPPVTNMLNFDPSDPRGTPVLTPIELLELKYGQGAYNPASAGVAREEHYSRNPPFHQQQQQHHQNDFTPIYEEVSEGKQSLRHFNLEDNEIPTRSLSSEDEFAEDEMSFGEGFRHPHSKSSSGIENAAGNYLRSSTGLGYRTERLPSKKKLGGTSANCPYQKHTQSLERNKDGHLSESFRAKQNYYMSKTMLGPDLSGENLPGTHGQRRSSGPKTRPRTKPRSRYNGPESHPYYACDPDLVQQAFYEPTSAAFKNFQHDHRSRRSPATGDPIFALIAKNRGGGARMLTFQPSSENVYSTIDDDESSVIHPSLKPPPVEVATDGSSSENYGDLRPDTSHCPS